MGVTLAGAHGLYCNRERKRREITGSAGHSCWQGFAAVAILYKEISWMMLPILMLLRFFCIPLQMLYKVILSRYSVQNQSCPQARDYLQKHQNRFEICCGNEKHPFSSELLKSRPEAAKKSQVPGDSGLRSSERR